MLNWTYLLEAPVTLALLGIILIWSLIAFWREDLHDKCLLVPYDMIAYKEYWRIFTHTFIHGNGSHLAFNGITLLFFGSLLEHRLGHISFLGLYLCSLLISGLAVTIRYREDSSYAGTVGASGPISGVVLAVAIINPFLRFGFPVITDLWPIISLPAWVMGSLFLLFSLVSMFIPKQKSVNHDAHLWGAVAGLVLALILKPQSVDVLEQILASV